MLVPVGGEIQHHAEPLVLLAAADRETLRHARHAVAIRTTALAAGLRPARERARLRSLRDRGGRPRARLRRGGSRPRGRVPGRPSGAALHREQRDDRRATRGRRGGGPRQPPVPVLHPQGPQTLAEADLRAGPGRPGRDRRRVRWQGGVPLDRGPPRVASRAQDRQARPDDLRPPRGPGRHDEAPPGDRHPPNRGQGRRDARRPGHRGGHGRRRVLHPHARRPEPGRPPRRRAVPLPERPDPGPRHPDEHPAERGLPRVRGAPDRVRRRDPARAPCRGPRSEPARHPPAQPLPGRRRDADRPDPARERRRRGGPRARRRGRRVRGRRGPDDDGACPPGGLGQRSRVAAPDRPGPDCLGHRRGPRLARRGVHRLRRGQARQRRLDRADRRGSRADPDRLDRDGPGDQDDLSAAGR